MEPYTLIANTGIQLLCFSLEIDTTTRYRKHFLESLDMDSGDLMLELLQERQYEGDTFYYRKRELLASGLIDPLTLEVDWDGVDELRIRPVEEEALESGKMSLTLSGNRFDFSTYENAWIPLPYFNLRGRSKVDFNAFNWVRAKFQPCPGEEGTLRYDVLVAVDTRAVASREQSRECPAFEAEHITELKFSLCRRESAVMDYCSVGREECHYIEEYLRSLAHPGVNEIRKIKGKHKYSYLASYVLFVHYLAEHGLMPELTLYTDRHAEYQNVDMIVDIGNSSTTSILAELSGTSPFSRLELLELQNYTHPVTHGKGGIRLRKHAEPFDMRVAFRKADFGTFGYKGGQQFVHPSLVRLGAEALDLTGMAVANGPGRETLTTYSSPKRYLWDAKPNCEEWEFLTLEGEDEQQAILDLPGVTSYLQQDGRVSQTGEAAGALTRYSRRSLMTLALLEMLAQARVQINSPERRKKYGLESHPRRLRRLLLTCPTTMSAEERHALVRCAQDAVFLLQANEPNNPRPIEVLPSYKPTPDGAPVWYYDEATCAQLVYLYSELGQKYCGSAKEYLQLYGHANAQTGEPELTVGSIDIGAGTSDLMICNYSIGASGLEQIRPQPLFYDSFYTAGDDMLYQLIREVLLRADASSLAQAYVPRPGYSYQQMLKDCCGPDYNGQSVADMRLRRDLNLQIFVPIMLHFLDLYSRGGATGSVSYCELFAQREPSEGVRRYFKHYVGAELETIKWRYDRELIGQTVSNFFEPLINKVSAIMFAHSCDLIVLSGRPTSLSPIRDLFLRYYPVAPNRLIRLNNHYVGDWYPFGNNTGYIKNPKTVVAVGAMIGFYGAELSTLDRFALNTDLLGQKVTSSMHYIEQPKQDSQAVEYCFTPTRHHGRATIYHLPAVLKVRKIDFATYPSRPLFRIDYNETALERRIRARLELMGAPRISQGQVREALQGEKERLRRLMPFQIELSREADALEEVEILSVADREGNELNTADFELIVQSLGVDQSYWLDSGIFYN